MQETDEETGDTVEREIPFLKGYTIPGLCPRSHAALEMAHDLIRNSSIDVLLFDSLHVLSSFTSGGTTSSPRSGELFEQRRTEPSQGGRSSAGARFTLDGGVGRLC